MLTGLHLLVTYRCTYACDHCFVWSGPSANARCLTVEKIGEILHQGAQVGTVRTIWFEGGEAFLHRDVLAQAIARATERDFDTGVVTNGYWATTPATARKTLAPLVDAGLKSLAVSIDALHGNSRAQRFAQNAICAAEEDGLSLLTLRTQAPPFYETPAPNDQAKVLFRGRAAELLADNVPKQAWSAFNSCPHERLADPARVHIDPFGYVHLCQGIVLGNLFECPLPSLLAEYEPDSHPIVGALLAKGPAGLVEEYDLSADTGYADACHLCYRSREQLRSQFAEYLAPSEMYGGSSAASIDCLN